MLLNSLVKSKLMIDCLESNQDISLYSAVPTKNNMVIRRKEFRMVMLYLYNYIDILTYFDDVNPGMTTESVHNITDTLSDIKELCRIGSSFIEKLKHLISGSHIELNDLILILTDYLQVKESLKVRRSLNKLEKKKRLLKINKCLNYIDIDHADFESVTGSVEGHDVCFYHDTHSIQHNHETDEEFDSDTSIRYNSVLN